MFSGVDSSHWVGGVDDEDKLGFFVYEGFHVL